MLSNKLMGRLAGLTGEVLSQCMPVSSDQMILFTLSVLGFIPHSCFLFITILLILLLLVVILVLLTVFFSQHMSFLICTLPTLSHSTVGGVSKWLCGT